MLLNSGICGHASRLINRELNKMNIQDNAGLRIFLIYGEEAFVDAASY